MADPILEKPFEEIPLSETSLIPEAEREERIQEFLTRAVETIYPSAEVLEQALKSGKRLTAYMGIDPTAPEMHVGHMSQLYKLRRLQDMGHKVILLIGDFTAMIGDPTDKSAARVKLTREQVLENAKSYKEQASKILDFDNPRNPIELRYNSEWLSKMGFGDVLELASEFSLQQISARDMFQKRMTEGKPVWMHELLYPLMQGQDSVAMDVDIEIGGSDQIFNMLVGSELIKRHRGKQKYVVGGNLLVDPSGKKIGKTEGNMITLIDTPEDMFHKVMLWGDQIVPHALELCTSIPMERIAEIKEQMDNGTLDGLTAKRMLAVAIVTELHSAEAAEKAAEAYESIGTGVYDTEDIPVSPISEGSSIIDMLIASGLATSKKNARTLIAQRGVRINGETVLDADQQINEALENAIVQVGKRRRESYRRLKIQK